MSTSGARRVFSASVPSNATLVLYVLRALKSSLTRLPHARSSRMHTRTAQQCRRRAAPCVALGRADADDLEESARLLGPPGTASGIVSDFSATAGPRHL